MIFNVLKIRDTKENLYLLLKYKIQLIFFISFILTNNTNKYYLYCLFRQTIQINIICIVCQISSYYRLNLILSFRLNHTSSNKLIVSHHITKNKNVYRSFSSIARDRQHSRSEFLEIDDHNGGALLLLYYDSLLRLHFKFVCNDQMHNFDNLKYFKWCSIKNYRELLNIVILFILLSLLNKQLWICF